MNLDSDSCSTLSKNNFSIKKFVNIKILICIRSGSIQTAEFNHVNFGELINHPSFRRDINTILFHYGAGQTLNTLQVNDVITSYMFNRGYNFVAVTYDDDSIIGTDVSVSLIKSWKMFLILLFSQQLIFRKESLHQSLNFSMLVTVLLA